MYCTLIIFHPYHSNAIYLDSGRDERKDYTEVKSTLDKALSGFVAEVGSSKLRQEKKVKGCYVSNHVTNFPCLKQSSSDNGMEAWFAILQMRAVVKDQQDLLLPSSLQNKVNKLRDTTDAEVRAEFRAIQRLISTIIFRDALKSGGLFHHKVIPSKIEIENRLHVSCDERTFNTLDGVRPFPPRET